MPQRDWAFSAAVYAMFFDAKSRAVAEKFAQGHNAELPPSIDPEGNFKRKVQLGHELGQHIGLSYTPTIFVVRRGAVLTDFVEVTDRSKLGRIIEDMLQKAYPPTPVKKASVRYPVYSWS